MAMLDIKNLSTEFVTDDGLVQAVRDVTLHVEKGEILGIVGESERNIRYVPCIHLSR